MIAYAGLIFLLSSWPAAAAESSTTMSSLWTEYRMLVTATVDPYSLILLIVVLFIMLAWVAHRLASTKRSHLTALLEERLRRLCSVH